MPAARCVPYCVDLITSPTLMQLNKRQIVLKCAEAFRECGYEQNLQTFVTESGRSSTEMSKGIRYKSSQTFGSQFRKSLLPVKIICNIKQWLWTRISIHATNWNFFAITKSIQRNLGTAWIEFKSGDSTTHYATVPPILVLR